jgi:ABC-type transport system substrate-binding protein
LQDKEDVDEDYGDYGDDSYGEQQMLEDKDDFAEDVSDGFGDSFGGGEDLGKHEKDEDKLFLADLLPVHQTYGGTDRQKMAELVKQELKKVGQKTLRMIVSQDDSLFSQADKEALSQVFN